MQFPHITPLIKQQQTSFKVGVRRKPQKTNVQTQSANVLSRDDLKEMRAHKELVKLKR